MPRFHRGQLLRVTTQGDENNPDFAVVIGSSHGWYEIFNAVPVPADTQPGWGLGRALDGQPLRLIALKADGSWTWVDKPGTRGKIDEPHKLEEFEP